MSDLDVLVVGAGPTGVMMAGELLRRGVKVRVVDRDGGPTTQSRAIGVHARTLEIFDELGIADDLVARGVPVTGATMWSGDSEVVAIDFDGLDTKFPFILCVSQVETESVLTKLLERRGGAVERRTELVSLAQDEGGVSAVLRGPSGDESVRASWVVGCDGAHSAVRKAVGAAFEGHTYEEVFALADVQIDWSVPASRVSTWLHEEGAVAFFPLLGHGGTRWRVIATAAAALGPEPKLDDLVALATRRVGRPVPMRDAAWLASFRIHCRQVERYRHGRVFLAGDAAHIHSPVGGQGMNTGIQDAHNLAWKLALAIRGHGTAALLDSYGTERHAVGKAVLRQTDLATKAGLVQGALVPVRNTLARLVTSFDVVREQVAHSASELAVGYEGSPIVGEARSSTFAARFGKAEAGETPTVASRLEFAGGPKPGARAPDGAITFDGEPTRLSRIWSGDAFTLLLFDGRSPSAAGYDTLVGIARRAKERWGDRVRPFLVTPSTSRPAAVPDDLPVIFDPGDLEAKYGAKTECLYLIRPDLYVGFRAQPADDAALTAHLTSLLG